MIDEEDVFCRYCDKVLPKGHRSQFCNPTCRVQYWRYGVSQEPERQCVVCGKQFNPTNWHHRLCSNACRSKLAREKKKSPLKQYLRSTDPKVRAVNDMLWKHQHRINVKVPQRVFKQHLYRIIDDISELIMGIDTYSERAQGALKLAGILQQELLKFIANPSNPHDDHSELP